MPHKRKRKAPKSLTEAGRSDRWMKASPLNVLIGSRIKAAREKQGVSLEDAADFLGVTLNTVWRYEAGRFRIPAVTILMLSVLLKQPVQVFFPETGDFE